MKHNIKLPDGTIQTIDCKLGSGVLDKNGREIFEGDIVKSGRTGATKPVRFFEGKFSAGAILLKYDSVEIVGHVED